jgi:hypothetical protein
LPLGSSWRSHCGAGPPVPTDASLARRDWSCGCGLSTQPDSSSLASWIRPPLSIRDQSGAAALCAAGVRPLRKAGPGVAVRAAASRRERLFNGSGATWVGASASGGRGRVPGAGALLGCCSRPPAGPPRLRLPSSGAGAGIPWMSPPRGGSCGALAGGAGPASPGAADPEPGVSAILSAASVAADAAPARAAAVPKRSFCAALPVGALPAARGGPSGRA